MPCRFYGQVTYDEQPQVYIFIDINARVPAVGSMYVIFHEPTKRYFRYNPTINQFELTKAKDSNGTTMYLLYQDLIFNQLTNQTNCQVK